MKVILFSLLALMSTTVIHAQNDTSEYGATYTYEKRFNHPHPTTLNDSKYNVKMTPATFEALVTTAFNAPNTNTEPLIELMQRIKDGKISHNASKQYTRITHKDFYYRLLPYIPLENYFSTVTMSKTIRDYEVQVNGKHAALLVAMWGSAGNHDHKVGLTYMQPAKIN